MIYVELKMINCLSVNDRKAYSKTFHSRKIQQQGCKFTKNRKKEQFHRRFLRGFACNLQLMANPVNL